MVPLLFVWVFFFLILLNFWSNTVKEISFLVRNGACVSCLRCVCGRYVPLFVSCSSILYSSGASCFLLLSEKNNLSKTEHVLDPLDATASDPVRGRCNQEPAHVDCIVFL